MDVSWNRTAALGLKNAADFMPFSESGAIKQARINNLAAYNDYGRATGAAPAEDFSDIVGSRDVPAE